MGSILGIHHITAIAGEPQKNLDFYAGVLGLRLVKRTVNFDDPGTYLFHFGQERRSAGGNTPPRSARELRAEHLERDGRSRLRSRGQVDGGHAALPAQALERVAVLKPVGEGGEEGVTRSGWELVESGPPGDMPPVGASVAGVSSLQLPAAGFVGSLEPPGQNDPAESPPPPLAFTAAKCHTFLLRCPAGRPVRRSIPCVRCSGGRAPSYSSP